MYTSPMPELPEVEAARRLLMRSAVGRRIVAVRCAPDEIVFQGVSPARVRRALVGRRIVAAHRHGKHLWLELDRRPWPCFHFGMSGGIEVRGRRRAKLVLEGRRAHEGQWPPRFLKLHLTLDDGGEIAFSDARRLGRVRLRHDPRAEPPISLLGFDALHDLPSLGRLAELFGARAAPVKAVLLDQSFSAGVGNWIADEVLYQAGIDPRRRTNTLTRAEIARLRAKLRFVVATAVRVGADSDRFPAKWLFHTRWSKRLKSPVTPRGERIRYLPVGGRATAWVAEVQR
jgi:formamidopyrimidine-DNA glycosylase